MYAVDGPVLNSYCESVVYITRSDVAVMSLIAQQVKSQTLQLSHKTYHVIMVPRRSVVAERVLEEEGVFADVVIGEMHLDWIPLYEDLWSLELNGNFR